MSRVIFTNKTLDLANCELIFMNCKLRMENCKLTDKLVRADEYSKVICENQSLKSQLEESRESINELEVKMIDKDWYINHLQSELKKCRKSLDDALFDSDLKDDKIELLKDKIAKLREENAKLREENAKPSENGEGTF